MRVPRRALYALAASLLAAVPALADSVTVTSGPNGNVVTSKPCRIVTCKGCAGGSNSTTVTTQPNGLRGSTTITQGNGATTTQNSGSSSSGAGSSVSVGSGSGSSSSVVVGSGSGGTRSSTAASGDCVIYRNE